MLLSKLFCAKLPSNDVALVEDFRGGHFRFWQILLQKSAAGYGWSAISLESDQF